MILVKVGKLGEKVKEYAVNDGTLVNAALSIARVPIDVLREEVHVVLGSSSRVHSLSAPLANGSILIVEPKKDPILDNVVDYIEDNFDVNEWDCVDIEQSAKQLIEIIRGK